MSEWDRVFSRNSLFSYCSRSSEILAERTAEARDRKIGRVGDAVAATAGLKGGGEASRTSDQPRHITPEYGGLEVCLASGRPEGEPESGIDLPHSEMMSQEMAGRSGRKRDSSPLANWQDAEID
ncbi:hypothetical protein QYF36_020048 [Acer negundo]|nr:hypothetical protein QYF36_020048 [Acer negundo]